MSSSSSDSESDDFDVMRRIKINIRPREEVTRRGAADVNEIRASVEAWRPLGPPTHSSLSRRQSSLSSVSSLSIGGGSIGGGANTNSIYGNNAQAPSQPSQQNQNSPSCHRFTKVSNTIQTSPSCLSLVNEFNTRSPFTNFMSAISRTSSTLTLANFSDTVPVAIAIQESIELIVKGHIGPRISDPEFNSRSIGNIKIAFPNSFASRINETSPTLKLDLHSTSNIIRYYADRLIKDLDIGTRSANDSALLGTLNYRSINGNLNDQSKEQISTPNSVDLGEADNNHKILELDMNVLRDKLRTMYEQSPMSKYYNVDVLRYQIAPVVTIETAPLQVCAYWKFETNVIKLRIDFCYSQRSGLDLDRLRDIIFTVNFAAFIPLGVDVNALSPDSLSNVRINDNNNDKAIINMNDFESNRARSNQLCFPSGRSLMDLELNTPTNFGDNAIHVKIPPLPSVILEASGAIENGRTQYNLNTAENSAMVHDKLTDLGNSLSRADGEPLVRQSSNIFGEERYNLKNPPFLTYKPQAHWDKSIKKLTWKFENLSAYHGTNGFGSLFAKLDFRNYQGMPSYSLENCDPTPVEVKFLVIDSTLSKINLTVESAGYKMSLLKREIRSGRYMSEPYIF